VLRAVAEHGRAGFDDGVAGRAVFAALNAGGHAVTQQDLTAYQPLWKQPLCATWRGSVLLSAPPPQTGAAPAAITPADAARHEGVPPAAACATYRPWPAEALAAAPQNRAIAGTGVAPGLPPTTTSVDIAYAGETTHLSIVDGAGNAVALTQTNSSTFGSGAWVSGFFLNDSGARVPEERMAGGSAAWRTPTSTIAPTIVLEDGRVRLVTGAPGAGRIPTEITQTMLYVLDYGMDLVDALRMPRVFPAAASPVVQLKHGFRPRTAGAGPGPRLHAGASGR
jgi:gamma-glutamyltranspeptidase / glutathione hydrolase